MRARLVALTLMVVAGASADRRASASVSLPVTWEALVKGSTAAAIVTPMEARAVWEDGRICTYAHVHVDQALAGDVTTGGDAWVRTLGGIIGRIGQIVDGEAVFSPGRASLVFLRPSVSGALSPRPVPLASEVLHGRLVADAARDVAAAWVTYRAR